MRTPKYKHLSFEDRCIIQEFLNYGHSFTEIGNRIGKDRTAISKEIRHHRFTKIRAASSSIDCPKTSKPPYVCNPCSSKPHCRKIQFIYDASVAHNEYLTVLSKQRSNLRITKEQIASINEIISPLMIHKHHSVNHVYASYPELLPFSKSTFYRYVDLGILSVGCFHPNKVEKLQKLLHGFRLLQSLFHGFLISVTQDSNACII